MGPATFVGAQACASCHREVQDTWKSGRHSKMLQPATEASVIGNFKAGAITLHESPYRLRVANGQYFITESYLTGGEWEHRIDYTLGSRRVQHYLTTLEDGRIVILPPSWDVQRRQWFDNMEIVRPDQFEGKPIQLWNKNCQGCHVSQQKNNYSPVNRTYATQWQDFGTSCERCHGPGSAHVETYARAKDPAEVTDHAIVRPTRLDPKTSSMICAQCHSFRETMASGFTAGANYYDYFLPLSEYGPRKDQDPPYWADGRPRRFSNDAIGLWQSRCFLRGGVTCTNCHRDPHAPNIEENAQLKSGNNVLCTRCHREIGANLTAHTRHGADSAGSACVECHMPKAVVAIKATMRDHTMSLPVPENTVKFGIPNACTDCHADKKAAWAVAALERWWPQGKRAKVVARAEAFTAARANRPEALERLIAIAADDSHGPLIRANAVGYLGGYNDPRAVRAALAAAKTDHPAVRAAAVSSLGRLNVDADAARSALLAALEDPQRAVRVSALQALVNLGSAGFTPEERRQIRQVSAEFANRARIYRDDASIQRDLGLLQLLNVDFERAADALQITVDLEPDMPSSRYLLALARIGQGRLDDARELLRNVPRSDPSHQAARQRLKQLDALPRTADESRNR
ncbi:MAG: HEAT repeat domain-containing protein [Acidobacteria bacterium]|nr:HEAT repeat domain-containing protein [Acidobacteriota bacterium]